MTEVDQVSAEKVLNQSWGASRCVGAKVIFLLVLSQATTSQPHDTLWWPTEADLKRWYWSWPPCIEHLTTPCLRDGYRDEILRSPNLCARRSW